ncbi:MAG: putative rane spanning protein [Gammaproteobacteria bacterium]|jgi:hypothetical protein|nr:putative rane spanning protein [Gammaproteobacteria bacterium]
MFPDKLKELIATPRQAMIWTAVLSAIPFLHWFGVLLMLLVTLRQGLQQGIKLAAIVAIISVIVFGFVLRLTTDQMVFQFINPLILCLLAYRLRETASWLNVTQMITGLGVLMVITIYLVFPQLAQTWSQLLVAMMKQVAVDRPELLSVWNAGQMLQLLGGFAVGLRVMLFVTLSLSSLIVARYIQAVLYNPGGLRQELYAWRLNFYTGILLLALIILAAVVRTPIWLSLIPVLILPFICVGFTVIHAVTASNKYQWLILLVFYVALLTIAPQLLTLVALLGCLDSLINFRKRFALKR